MDSDDLAPAVTAKLLLTAGLGFVSCDSASVAAALSGVAMATEGSVADLSMRNNISFSFSQREVVRVAAGDAVPVRASTTGAGDIGHDAGGTACECLSCIPTLIRRGRGTGSACTPCNRFGKTAPISHASTGRLLFHGSTLHPPAGAVA